MATPNKLEVILSFKPLMDGLNRFISGYQTRMAQVQAFNQRIQNGEAAVQKALAQVGAVLGGAALVKYAKDAREADQIQQQLNRTLERTGESGAADALNAQATALQRVTKFSDESVSTVQRLLISFGLTGQQAEAMTENVLDLAQETGQSAESAAMLIGRTLRGETDELGRLNIKLDTTKGKVDSIREALKKFAGGAARGAVADKAGRDIEARYADATENIGRVANTAAVPFFQALLPLLEKFSAWATANAGNIAAIARSMGDIAVQAAPAVVGFGALKGAMTAVSMVLNPLRELVVAFSGRSLVELSNQLAKSSGGFSGLWTTLKNGGGAITGIGSALSVMGSVAAAAFAGWQLGSMINELEVSGLKVKDWAAIILVYVQDKVGAVWADMRKAWAITKEAGLAFWDALKIATIIGVMMILDAWNKLPFGKKFDLSPLRDELDKTATHLANTGARLKYELGKIDKDRIAQMAENAELIAFIEKTGKAANQPTATKPAAATTTRTDLNTEHFGDTDAAKKAAKDLADKRALYAAETRIIEAKVIGNQKLVDELTRQKDRTQALAELGADAVKIVDERIDAEKRLTDVQRKRQEDEQNLSRRIASGEESLQLIEQSKFLTQDQKDLARIEILKKINSQIEARITLLEKEQALNPSPDRQQQIDDLRSKRGQNQASIADATPLTFSQSVAAGLNDYLAQTQTLINQVRAGVQSIGQALQTGIASSISGLINRTMTWRDALLNIGQAVVQGLINAFANMAAQWIAKQIMMAIFGKALQAAQLAALAPIAAAAAMLWAPAATAASIATLGSAAIEGAATAKMAIVSSALGLATGGIVRGPGTGTSDSILARLSNGEGVLNARATSLVGEDFINSLNAGALSLAALPASVASQLPSAASSARSSSPTLLSADSTGQGGAPRVNVAYFNDEAAAMSWLNKQSGRKVLYRRLNQERSELGLES
jgi:hypothetical protein